MAWDVRGKTALITGATSGIGLEASVALARRGARVVMVGRDPARTESARSTVSERSGSQEVEHLVCDFSSQAAIRALAEEFQARHDRLDILLNNAGAVNRRRTLTGDGIETTFAVNHLGYFLLTNLVTDLLVRSTPARVVTVASIGHRSGTLDLDDLGFERNYSLMEAYKRSKLCNVLFANELARRLKGTGVTSNSLHPGGVNTNIWSGAPLWAKPIIALFLRRTFISAEQGASYVVALAANPDLANVTGAYFEQDKELPPSPLAQDKELAHRLWNISTTLVDLPAPGCSGA